MRTIRRTNASLLLALVGGAVFSGASLAAPIVYQQDFESANTVGKEWGQRGISNTQELGKFSNRMNNNELTLTVNTMSDQVYTLVFDLYLFGAWTGGNQNISVRAEGKEVFRETFTNTGDWSQQSFDRPPDLFGDLGYAPTMDSAYRGIALEFDGRNPSVTLRFMGQNLGNMGSQSWAIDNVTVYQGVLAAAAPAVPGPATAGLGLLGAATLLRRRRRAAAVDRGGATAACAAGAGPDLPPGLREPADDRERVVVEVDGARRRADAVHLSPDERDADADAAHARRCRLHPAIRPVPDRLVGRQPPRLGHRPIQCACR